MRHKNRKGIFFVFIQPQETAKEKIAMMKKNTVVKKVSIIIAKLVASISLVFRLCRKHIWNISMERRFRAFQPQKNSTLYSQGITQNEHSAT